MIRVHLVIVGRVQQVFFRQSTREKALELGLRGWVRNRKSGTVELVAEGESQPIEHLVEWCHRGPEHARVERVDRWDAEPVDLPEGFNVRPTE